MGASHGPQEMSEADIMAADYPTLRFWSQEVLLDMQELLRVWRRGKELVIKSD
jgi:hypothetical protein